MKSQPATHSPASSLDDFEYRCVFPKQGRTLIVGSHVYGTKEDRRKRYPDVVGVDMIDGPGVDWVMDLEEPVSDGLGTFDHVECMSVLEHSKRPWKLAETIEGLMNPGATLFVAVPLCWRIHAYPDDFWRFTPSALPLLFPSITWEARMLASVNLTQGPKFPVLKSSGYPYLARTETVGFGHK